MAIDPSNDLKCIYGPGAMCVHGAYIYLCDTGLSAGAVGFMLLKRITPTNWQLHDYYEMPVRAVVPGVYTQDVPVGVAVVGTKCYVLTAYIGAAAPIRLRVYELATPESGTMVFSKSVDIEVAAPGPYFISNLRPAVGCLYFGAMGRVTTPPIPNYLYKLDLEGALISRTALDSTINMQGLVVG